MVKVKYDLEASQSEREEIEKRKEKLKKIGYKLVDFDNKYLYFDK